jgi:hypothetical protein
MLADNDGTSLSRDGFYTPPRRGPSVGAMARTADGVGPKPSRSMGKALSRWHYRCEDQLLAGGVGTSAHVWTDRESGADSPIRTVKSLTGPQGTVYPVTDPPGMGAKVIGSSVLGESSGVRAADRVQHPARQTGTGCA